MVGAERFELPTLCSQSGMGPKCLCWKEFIGAKLLRGKTTRQAEGEALATVGMTVAFGTGCSTKSSPIIIL